MGFRSRALFCTGALALLLSFSARAQPADAAGAAAAPPPEPAPVEAAQPARVETVDERLKVIVLQLKSATLPAEQAGMITGLLTVVLSEFEAFEVVSDADVRQLVELEGEKQALGCEADASCLAEIAGAMGARLVVFGEAGKLGSRYLVNLNLYDSQDAKSVGRAAITAPDLDAVVEGMPSAVESLVTPFLESEKLSTKRKGSARVEATTTTPPPKVEAPTTTPPEEGGLGWLTWTGGITAVVGVGAATALYALRFALAATTGAEPEMLRDFRWPVAGALIALLDPALQEPDRKDDAGAVLLLSFFGAETVAALVGLAGATMWTVGYFGDGPPLSFAGHAWRWSFVAGGAALASGGLAWDLAMPTSSDNRLDGADFVPVGLYAAGAAGVATGLFLNPFAGGEE